MGFGFTKFAKGIEIVPNTKVGTFTNTSETVTGIDTSNLFPGMGVSSSYVPSGTTITSIGTNTILLSNPAVGSATTTIAFLSNTT